MSAKNYITLFRALKTDYAYLIALMGFSWLSIYGYPGECKFYNVVATFSFLLLLRCRYFHFLMLLLIGGYPLVRYPLQGRGESLSDTVVELLYHYPLEALRVLQQVSLSDWVPSLILLTLMVILTGLQRVKTPGFNLLRLEFFIITCTIIGVTTLMEVIKGGGGWSSSYLVYPPLHYGIESVTALLSIVQGLW